MSILDGNVVLDREPNKNKESKKRGNDKKRRNRSYDNYDYSFNNSSYLPEEERGQAIEDGAANITIDHRSNEINDFCDDFVENVQNYRSLQDVVIDGLPDVIGYIKSYYSGKTTPDFVDAMNRLIKTISTTQFANTLSSVLDSGVWAGGVYDKIWRNLAYALSLALETSCERMHTDVIRKYATVILPRMWKPEINELTTMNGITKDLALDLIIAIPLANTNEWNGANIDAFYSRFLDKMLDHAEDNMDVLNWEVQGSLYDNFFGTGKTALKIIGKYLTSDKLKESDSDVVNAVYKEFIKMLYSKLDKYDIEDIKYVFNYVARYRAENKDKTTLFDVSTAKQYENVRKGLLAVMDENPSSMESLA